MKMRTGLLAIGAACAACCVPLLLPLLAGAGLGTAAAGGALLFGLTLDQLLCFGLPAAILAALVAAWGLKRLRAGPADCGCQDQCAAEAATCSSQRRLS